MGWSYILHSAKYQSTVEFEPRISRLAALQYRRPRIYHFLIGTYMSYLEKT